jgi:hypothetical protein
MAVYNYCLLNVVLWRAPEKDGDTVSIWPLCWEEIPDMPIHSNDVIVISVNWI